ncbi:GNAT family N-acetyltransferase [Flavobacterium humi]|uniref:GNAT family N-acetyltransferase n=1 Tax=Flavobacterium humi TaxID=2562683 RepID=A0A4Z0L6X4_9FLAO|nr:GNAT family N-acetyltransferase [Flavobacterium humi]TGD56735.1 GNAT family N-acetyltransferase [Flavobacterium humi]
MIIRTLENTSTDQILDAFNLSFSDYLVPVRLSEEQFVNKIKSDSIDLSLSAGAFEGNDLIGFILHGKDTVNGENKAYNAGTGVIPNRRGNNITGKLYDFIIPQLKNKGISQIQLEVLTENHVAKHTYHKLGFRTNRELDCYKGNVSKKVKDSAVIKPLKGYDWDLLQSFWDCEPSWQNSVTAVENLFGANISIGIYDGEDLMGYLIFNPVTKRIHQLAVDRKRRKEGLGKQLLNYVLTEESVPVTVINVDKKAVGAEAFLKTSGFDIFISQYEMTLDI